MSTKQSVSIIIPCKNVDEYTRNCISYCKKLDYPNFEIILLPDNETDPIDDVRIITTGPVSPGVKRNIGVQELRNEYCAFIDNDAYPRSDWLTNAMKYFEYADVGGVGGPGLTPEEDNYKQKASGYVLSSFMVGNLSNRYKTKKCFESDDIHSCNFIARRSVVEAVGGWNEKYWPGEDTLMCLAITNLPMKLIEASDVVVYHHRRSLFKPHLKQVSRFGEHRGFFVKKFSDNSMKLTYFFPSLLLSSFIVGIVLSMIFPYFVFIMLFGVGAYLISSLVAASLQVKRAKLLLLVWLGIITTHIVYGFFFLSGLVKRDLKR